MSGLSWGARRDLGAPVDGLSEMEVLDVEKDLAHGRRKSGEPSGASLSLPRQTRTRDGV